MCGRYVVAKTALDLSREYRVDLLGEEIPEPSWNIKPTQLIPVIVDAVAPASEASEHVQRRLERARWSLIPPWVTDTAPTFSTFNARSEGAATKASWKAAVARTRCLIPASGYYEWVTTGTGKTPYYIDGVEHLTFAGLYSWWRATEHDPWMLTASILTMPTVPQLAHIHDRTPVTLPETMWDAWLDPLTVGDQALVDAAVTAAQPVAATLTAYPVRPLRGDGPALIEP
jgi:putative SOS response-associated peptidase YedK